MIGNHLVRYFTARGLAAALNVGSVIVFTRLAGAETYGGYLLMFAAAAIVNGVAVQWVHYSFFNVYSSDDDRALLASFLALAGVSMAATTVAAIGLFAFGPFSLAFAMGALAIGVSASLFDVATQFSRTRLDVGRATLGIMLRAALMLAFGSTALLLDRSPVSLALGIALAHMAAAVPGLASAATVVRGRPDWASVASLVRFGWPLMLSFGVAMCAQTVERFVLAEAHGAAAVGAYGALSDFVRNLFLVAADSISLALIPLAKRQLAAGDDTSARKTLFFAYELLVVLGAFGFAFFALFGSLVLDVLFPRGFLTHDGVLITLIVVSAVCLVVRTAYLAQIIYFTNASRLELASACVLLIVNTTLALVLVPPYGARGAALAFLGGQIGSGLLFVLANRGTFRLPLPLRPLIAVLAVALALVGAGLAIDATALGAPAAFVTKAVVFTAGFVLTVFALEPAMVRRILREQVVTRALSTRFARQYDPARRGRPAE
jgi:O-antigen/teichoic acid export membrane protein